jgi:hypothetical protein
VGKIICAKRKMVKGICYYQFRGVNLCAKSFVFGKIVIRIGIEYKE